jgi:putative N6-adenine-specific DNA methylase
MGLHKRGYRELTYTAPLKETIAASLIDFSIAKPNKAFADIFCGSGTIAIEFAMLAKNIAPGLERHFDFEKFNCYPAGILEKTKCEAKKMQNDCVPKIYACDENSDAIKMAKANAKRAGVDKYITFEVKDMRNFVPSEDFGVIISNVPYGERLSTKPEVKKLYADFFKMMKNYPTWSSYILTDDKELEKIAGRKADKKRKLFNARIECTYYAFLGEKPKKSQN